MKSFSALVKSLSVLVAFGCATATIEDDGLPDDNDGDIGGTGGRAGSGGTGNSSGGAIGDGDGDGDLVGDTGGSPMGDGDGDMGTGGNGGSATGGNGSGGATSSCAPCTAWSTFNYNASVYPSIGQCVTSASGMNYIYESGETTQLECGPPGAERPGWCTDTNSVFSLCD